MFDKILKELSKLDKGLDLTVDVPTDEDGYLDRQCPGEHCGVEFKVDFEDWKTKIRNNEAFCPICGKKASSDTWYTTEQVRYIEQIAVAHLEQTVYHALSIDAHRFNSSQKPGFIQLSLSVTPSEPPIILPIEAANAMRQKFTCEVCGCRYASIGAAFFCVACGHNSVLSTFDQAMTTVRHTIAGLVGIRETLMTNFDEDVAHNTIREIVENNLGRLVGAFEHLAKALYEKLPTAGKLPRPNIFQNVQDGSALWHHATGKGYEDFLSNPEMLDLIRLFQQRHVLTHCQGIVDQPYPTKTGDTTYAAGQRLVVRETDVIRLANLIVPLASGLRTLVP